MLAILKHLPPKSKKEATIYAALIAAVLKLLAQKSKDEGPAPPSQTVINVYNQQMDLAKK